MRSSSEEGEGADAEVGEAEPDEACQQKMAQMPERRCKHCRGGKDEQGWRLALLQLREDRSLGL